jgi:putative membrane-bound dehydrogenase-like protein
MQKRESLHFVRSDRRIGRLQLAGQIGYNRERLTIPFVPPFAMTMRTLPLFALVASIGCFFVSPLMGQDKKHVVFVAGRASHGHGAHDHFAGCKLLAEVVEKSDSNVKCTVVRDGWPKDDSVLDKADAIVIYADGGGGHPALPHLDRVKPQIDRGAGFVCLHYAVEVPKETAGPQFVKWLGGYFETHWSVNPIWEASFVDLPKHPVAAGVKPFKMFDEWYFHMRFAENMTGVTPILSAVAPESTMSRPNGPHSGNDAVRKEVARGDKQHVAWATERPDGGRSFGFTGGHFHWNWGRVEQTRLVANAILWTAKAKIPEGGALVETMTMDKLLENIDEPLPANFNAEKIAKEFGVLPGKPVAATTNKDARNLFTTPTVNSKTSRQQIDAEVDIKGVKKLYLIVTPGMDGFSCDWADWINPTLVGPNGTKSLLELDWAQASSDWGNVNKNTNAAGGPLMVRKNQMKGIGTHAYSVIAYDLPAGYEKFTVTCALDDGGVTQNNGTATSVRFHIAAEGIPEGLNNWGQNPENAADVRNPENAVSGLTIADGLVATLAASEPKLKSLTNLDIDHRGRVWVCEVVNYRKHKDDRQEGDRILILEDTNQDGIMDTSKVFYQGRDIDSALGLCVLGNRVLVSAAPYVFEFIDENGDDVPDKKTAILTKTGDPQHDHSVHSFLFGPDGKLYFNYGNTGHRLCDKDGQPIKDRWGRAIDDSGKPYRQGMVFRCNEDLSDMEVLGHNFRNNYEVSIDSFGSLWQSDNDDDGNRATRINFVMEYGNYGYVDELTGAGWQAERTNWETEIPSRHWHLNDPGVVPTMLITGAGSPTGITVYEGDLLPAKFRNQVIHCDAGPNVVRAYPATPDGAGYKATIENLMVGEVDRWFRPADVCVAPDGSLFVSDWYDPGVGGHLMEDMERGRLFRLAPPHTKYVVPKFDLSTAEGAATALSNPNNSVRFLAFKALEKMGASAEPALQKLAKNPNPRLRARAFWVLARIGKGENIAKQALADGDADVRITGVRIARQYKVPTEKYIPDVLKDSAPSVLREACIALREDTSAKMPEYWVALAGKYDGKDRWYLESLGIAAMDRWDDCLTALKAKPLANKQAEEKIIWRARGNQAASLQAALLRRPNIPDQEIPALFRALDFQSKESRDSALKSILDLVP